MQQHETIQAVYRPPFKFMEPASVYRLPIGETIFDIVQSIPDLPKDFDKYGSVLINGEEVPRNLWRFVRPKLATEKLPIIITLHSTPHGGKSTKSIIGLVAAVALLAVTTFLTGGAAAAAFPLLGETILGVFTVGQVLAGAIGIAGALAIAALTAPPTTQDQQAAIDSNSNDKEAASAQANSLERGGAIPRVLGTRKIFPPFACEPVVELVSQDEQVEALFVLNGPHALNDLRIDGTHITADSDDIDLETREGWQGDRPLTLVQRQGRTSVPNLSLSNFDLASDAVSLRNQSIPEQSLPVWHGFSSRNAPDEIWLQFLCPAGIYNTSTSPPSGLEMPLRISFRKRGTSTWINLPQLHLGTNAPKQFRAAILFKWSSGPWNEPTANNGWVFAHAAPPSQTATPATPSDRAWVADSYFTGGAGNDYWYKGSAASKIQFIGFNENIATVFLDEGTFPKGIYEFQVKRGTSLVPSSFSRPSYIYGGLVRDFFWYITSGTNLCNVSNTGYSDQILLSRVVSIWNEPPITQSGFALIAIRALNRSVRNLSVVASGYVRDWDGSGWNDWTTTSNPAPHYADILSGAQNLDPLPPDLRDDAGLAAWRTLCNTNDWTVDAIISDMRTQDVLQLVASCAYARPYQSDVYGVIVDKDRTGDAPIQVFSRRNSSGMRYERAFARLPAGLNITYRDEVADEDQAQTIVYQSNEQLTDLTLLENISFEGIIDRVKVETRAQFDLDQASKRATFYYLDTDIENLVCRRGDLVGVQHDILTKRAGDGYLYDKVLSGSPNMIVAFQLESEVPITNEPDMHATTDMHAVPDMHNVGVVTGVMVRHTDGTLSTYALSNSTGSSSLLTLATPVADISTIKAYNVTQHKYGSMVTVGQLGVEYRRLLVQQIVPKKDLTASLVLVDEAPDLVRYSP